MAIGLALAMCWLPSIAGAQTEAAPPSPMVGKGDPSLCIVGESEVATSPTATRHPLLLACNGTGTLLGEADQYDVFVNKGLQAVLIDIQRSGRRRILLATVKTDGPPLIEDISGQFAIAAGEGPTSPIDDLEVDLAAFASTGMVGVKGGAGDQGVAAEAGVDLGQQIAAVRAEAVATAAQGRPVGQ